MTRPSLPAPGRIARLLAAASLLMGALLIPATPALAADGLKVDAHVLMQGHVRAGSWFGVAVNLQNDGPTVTGELRISGGTDSRTRFATPVELATGSRKQYVLYALPPAFGGNMTVELVDGSKAVATSKVAIALHDQTQLVVGLVAENPARLVGQLDLLPNQNGLAPVIVPMTTADLPERVQAWAALDRLIWQDTDSASLTPGQLAAMRTWIAGGGRLVIVGGSSPADELTAFPDDLLPYRPSSLVDVDPSSLASVLGPIPAGATAVPAFAGDAGAGADPGDVRRPRDRGGPDVRLGSVTLLGFDPATQWIADGDTVDVPLWRRLLPPRSGGTVSLVDDQTIVSAVSNLPSLALPPIGGLLVLLFGYIVLVGPVNYLVLRSIDRREWAWVTVPVLIAVFTVGSFGIGAVLRGSDVILNEVAIVRGAPGTDAATTQSYIGIFSPSRATYQLRVAGDALIAAPMNGDLGDGGSNLDVLQGDPSRVRDLAVGFGSMRTVRAEASATGPMVTSDLRLDGGRIKGTVTNGSSRTLIAPAVVLGVSAVKIGDIAPGQSAKVDLVLISNAFNGTALSDSVVGPFDWGGGTITDDEQRAFVRRSIVDQLSFDPNTGINTGLPGDTPTLLAWGDEPVVSAELDGAQVRREANVLYEVPLPLTVRGKTTFSGDLLRSSAIDVSANSFSKDPWNISFGIGQVTMAYQPLPFEGSFKPEQVVVAMGFGGDITTLTGAQAVLRESPRCDPAADGCIVPQDGLPDLEALDVRTGKWVQFAHMSGGQVFELENAARWVNPTSGQVQVKFVNEKQDGIGFQFQVQITGTVQ